MEGTTPTPRTLAAGPGGAELASVLDLRLASIWSELFEVPPEQWNHDLIGWFLRAAYGQGYCDAHARAGSRRALS